jgi:hypothetical protein
MRKPPVNPEEVDGVFEVVGVNTVPRGVAVAVYQNRVLWMGPARILENVDVSKWPDGTYLNISSADLVLVKDIVERVEEGLPRDQIEKRP